MSYADTVNRRRPGTALAVLAIEGLLAWGVVAALVTHGRPTEIIHVLAQQIPLPKDLPKPTPPQHRDTNQQTQPRHDQTDTMINLGPITPPTFTPNDLPPGPNEFFPPTRPIEPAKPAKPAFAVIGARPHGRSSGWISDSDYPTGDLRLEHQGTTRYRLGVGSDGRVNSCTITQSSGWPGLDAATCAKLTERAHFDPASDETGTKVAGSWTGSVTWRIPAGE